MEQKSRKTLNITSIAFSIIVFTFFVYLLVILANIIGRSEIPYDRDETQHAIDGWEVYLATKNVSWTELDWAIRNQAFYPPINSFFVAAGYFFLGPSLAAGRLVTLAMFAGAVLMLGIMTYKTSLSTFENPERARSASLIGAAFSILLAIASEPFVLHGTVVMMEMSGAFLVLALFFFGSQRSNWLIKEYSVIRILAAIGIFLVFLSKYSFGFFFPALILAILTKTKEDYWKWSQWNSVLIISVTFLFLVAFWVLLLYDRQSFFAFFTEHPIDAPFFSIENLTFYPKTWLYEYSPSPTWGLIVIALAVNAVKMYWKRFTVRMAFWSIIFGLLALTIAPTNINRYILVAIPLIWFLAGVGLCNFIYSTVPKHNNIAAVPLILAIVLMSFAFETSDFFLRLPRNVNRYFAGKPVYSQLENFIIDNVDFDKSVALYGDFGNRHGLEALRWQAGVSTGQSLWDLHIDLIPLRIREGKIDRANRKSQLSDGNPNNLRSSLFEIIDSGYYSYLVEEYQLDDEMPIIVDEMDPSLGQYIVASADFEDWRVNIYRLED